MTLATRLVLELLRDARSHEVHGYELIKMTSLPSGTLYPMLLRLERAGLVTSRWVDEEGKRKRRFYSITPDGAERLRAAQAERPAGFHLKLAGRISA